LKRSSNLTVMFLTHENDLRSLKWSTVAPKSTEGENKMNIRELKKQNSRFSHQNTNEWAAIE
jgi:hypothetical protein